MARARTFGVFKPDDHPCASDRAIREDLEALGERLFPGAKDLKPNLPPGYAVLAQSPRLALSIASLASYIERRMPWSQRLNVRELAVQALNLHFKCDFSFRAHCIYGQSQGVSLEKQTAISHWRTSGLLSAEERLVVQYSFAVVTGTVSDELFSEVVARYEERGAIELTTAVAWWSLWAMILNATRPSSPLVNPSPQHGAHPLSQES